KVWNDAAAVSARPESVTLIISGTKADGTSEELTRATLTTENTENWTVAREVAVAKYDASGAAYTGYSITELASTGYEVAVVANGSDYTVTNTLSATTSVKIAKIWLDEETTHGDVTVQLYRAITGEAEKAVGEPVTFAKDHEWKDLAKYDASGAEYTYTVKETSTHAGYEVLPVAGGLENGIYKYTITNRKTGTTALTIQKNWNDDATKDTARQDVTFTLQRKVVGDAAATTCGTLKVTAPSWTATAENLPKYNENGKLYTYSIVEQTIGGYESKIAAPVEKDGTLFFEVTNTRRGTHTIQGEKVWRDGNSAARPTSVTITLERYTLSDGKMVKDVTFGTKESVASAANGWKYSFNDVESFDANGKSYNYVLNETGLSNSEYKMTLEQLNNTVDIVNINVVNTLTGTVSVEIVKDWHDATDKDRPENVTMTLTRKTSVGADASFSEKFTLNTANSWGKTFDALAKYDAEGRLYEYAVSEDAVAGYEEDSSKGAVNIKDNKVTIHVANVRKDDTGRLVAT
ncbi:MAG: Cna B-type domain-containing protein, partial [Pygmaiobacter sp.]